LKSTLILRLLIPVPINPIIRKNILDPYVPLPVVLDPEKHYRYLSSKGHLTKTLLCCFRYFTYKLIHSWGIHLLVLTSTHPTIYPSQIIFAYGCEFAQKFANIGNFALCCIARSRLRYVPHSAESWPKKTCQKSAEISI
jgi:hypothetical protein